MKCKICGKVAESDFCEWHRKAYENLKKNYEAWERSMNISWAEYLREMQKNPYAGIWVKEVAHYLLSSDSNDK